MNYPLISEYIDAIKSAANNFDKLSNLSPVLGADGKLIMSKGRFAVVFKMTDGRKNYAIKCFMRDQKGRDVAYRQIAEELEFVSSTFLSPIRYYEKELRVNAKNTTDKEFSVLQMDWVEGVTLDNYVRNHLHDQYALECLAYNFCRMSQWLLTQSFAHGDLNPDNIFVGEDGSLVMVDYDCMFVPAMKGTKARELGSHNYRHPQRKEEQFDEHNDDFALASIALTLMAIALNPELYNKFGSADHLLFSKEDFRNLAQSKCISALQPLMDNADFLRLYGLFLLAYTEQSLSNVSFRLFNISKPEKPNLPEVLAIEETAQDLAEDWVDEFGVKYSKDGKELLIAEKDGIKKYNIRPGTKVICDDAFSFCESLQSITIPNSVTSIEINAFSYCESLQSITIPDSVTCIGDMAFSHCDSLQSVTIPDSVTSIGDMAFYHCDSLQSITIPDSVTSLGDMTFQDCSSLKSITIPDSMTVIGDWAFQSCSSLQNITIPASVTSIGNGIFSGCDLNLVSYSSKFISDGICLIDLVSKCILSCHRKNIKKYSIPDSVTSIGDYAFQGCSSLLNISIPDSMTSIGNWAFDSCSSLQNITIPGSVTSIGRGIFSGCDLNLVSYSSKFISDGICLIDLESKCILCCHRKNIKKYSIPDSVTSIGYGSFKGCKYLKNITIPDSVTKICNSAFYICASLQSITIPDSVTSIGIGAFEGCSSLKSIYIPRGKRSKFEKLLPREKNKLVEI